MRAREHPISSFITILLHALGRATGNQKCKFKNFQQKCKYISHRSPKLMVKFRIGTRISAEHAENLVWRNTFTHMPFFCPPQCRRCVCENLHLFLFFVAKNPINLSV